MKISALGLVCKVIENCLLFFFHSIFANCCGTFCSGSSNCFTILMFVRELKLPMCGGMAA